MRILPLFLLLLTACSMRGDKKPIVEDRLLFILHAETASIDMMDGTTMNGMLTLHDVNDSVAFFSERPNRRAGNVPLKRFIDDWDSGADSFSLQPPNAGFIYFAPSDSPKRQTAHYSELNLVLRNPRYNSKKDTLTFDYTLLSPGTHVKEGSLLEPTLFIDSASRQYNR